LIEVANLSLKVGVGLIDVVGQDTGVRVTDTVVVNVVALVSVTAHVIAVAGTVIGSTVIVHLGKLIYLLRKGNRTVSAR